VPEEVIGTGLPPEEQDGGLSGLGLEGLASNEPGNVLGLALLTSLAAEDVTAPADVQKAR
jgi:hypothetical protein